MNGYNNFMSEAFDPYLHWLGIRDPERPPNHYRLLGVALFEDDADVLGNAADRQMSHVRTFQTGPHSAESQKLLNELAAAKLCLLSSEKKKVYDAELRARHARQPVAPPAPPVAPPPLPRLEPPVAAPSPQARVYLETPVVDPGYHRPKAVRSSRRDSTSAALALTLFGILLLLVLGLIFLYSKYNEPPAKSHGKTACVQKAATVGRGAGCRGATSGRGFMTDAFSRPSSFPARRRFARRRADRKGTFRRRSVPSAVRPARPRRSCR